MTRGLSSDTIAAQATPPGRGGVGIIRVSGPLATSVAQAVLGQIPPARVAKHLPFLDVTAEPIDVGIALLFPSPNSFTGEDVLELQGHGGPVVMDLLLKRVLALGVRLAQPGEFSQRAFLNDKLDLAQTEAIADLINSSTEAAARSALRSLNGEFSRRIAALLERVIHLRMYVEAAIDFPEEEIDFLADRSVLERLDGVLGSLEQVRNAARQGCVLQEGMSVVILGQPNAGKSSLLNQLAGRDTAIVTDIPGTTRDVLRERIHLDGMPLHIVDTAGLREAADAVEAEGIRRAWKEVEKADRVLLVVDDASGISPADQAILQNLPDTAAVTVVRNKVDQSGREAGVAHSVAGRTEILLSAKTGEGIDALREHLKICMGYSGVTEGLFTARRRHLEALDHALLAVHRGRDLLVSRHAGELLAEELRYAQTALNEITGQFDNEALLGRIFSSFCIGK